jgi:hypothetical protein
MPHRHPITVPVGRTIALFVAVSVTWASAQTPEETLDSTGVLFDESTAERPMAEPWVGWHGPLDDGLLGLRFGMDRFTVGRILRERELRGRSSRAHMLRFEGSVLSRNGEVLVEFRPDSATPNGERLSRIQIIWTIEGVPHGALSLFERLDGMLRSRYGEARLVEEDGFAALDNGWGQYRRVYAGPQAKALLHLESTRQERYRLTLHLESPQLQVPLRQAGAE